MSNRLAPGALFGVWVFRHNYVLLSPHPSSGECGDTGSHITQTVRSWWAPLQARGKDQVPCLCACEVSEAWKEQFVPGADRKSERERERERERNK